MNINQPKISSWYRIVDIKRAIHCVETLVPSLNKVDIKIRSTFWQ